MKMRQMGIRALGLLLAITLSTGELVARDRILFRLDGFDHLESELPDGLQLSLYELEKTHYENLSRILHEALFEIYLEEEATRLKKTPAEIRTTYLSVKAPEEARVEAFYNRIEHRIKGSRETVRAQIVQLLRQQDMEAKKARLLAAYGQKKKFEITLPRPRPPFVEIDTEGFPTKGNPTAPVTIVDFADYQCPHCKTAARALAKLHERYKEHVRIVYMDYPINASGVSHRIAKGGFCAQKSGKFQEYHDLAYKSQGSLNASSHLDIAGKIGLDMAAFSNCHSSEEAENRVARSKREGRRLLLTSTPTLFVNGKRVDLTSDIHRDLIDAVEKALARKTSR